MARRGIEDIESLSSRELDRLSTELLAQGGARGRLSRASVWTYVRNIRLFLGWAAKEWEVVTGEATLPRLSRPLVETLEREEIQRIEDVAAERDKRPHLNVFGWAQDL